MIRLTLYGKHAIVIERFERDEITFADPVDGERHVQSAQVMLDAWQSADSEALLIRGTNS